MRTLIALLVLASPLIAAPQAERSKQVEFYGVVRDANNAPLANCELTVTSPCPNRYPRFPASDFLATGQAQLNTTTASDGSFRFKIDTSELQWLQPGLGAIVAHTQDGQFSLTSYRLSRGLVDLPLEIQLTPAGQQAIRVVDPSGKPLPNIKVRPARYGDIYVPLTVSDRFQATTDTEGLAKLPASDQALTGVIVIDPESLHQFLVPADEANHVQRVVLQPGIARQVRCLPPDSSKPDDIGRIEWLLISFRNSDEKMNFAWQRTVTNGTEPVEVKLPVGSFFAMSDTHHGHGWHNSSQDIELAEQANIEMRLQQALHITGKVVAKENGQPLPGIKLVHYLSHQQILSSPDGTYALWLPRISDGTYPMDPLEEYFYSDAFFVSPAAEHSPGEARIKPFEMTRCPTAIGTVLGPDGKPMAGIKVMCESKQERFTNNTELLTDRHGNFRFNNVGDGTPVKLTVMDRRGVTAEPVEVTIKPDASPLVRLVEPSPKRLQGRVVDNTGKPVAGAAIEVQLGRVSIDSGVRPIQYDMQDAFANAARKRFVTGADGRFETDEIIDWRHVFALKLTHPDYYESLSGLQHVDRSATDASTFDFGDVTMWRTPARQTITVKAVDPNGVPVAGAKVLCIQGRNSADQATTDDRGTVTFSAKRASAVIAARHEKVTVFRSLSDNQSEITLTLNAQQPPAKWQAFPGTAQERQAVATRLLQNFELAKTLDVAQASDGEIISLLSAIVYANPTVVMPLATTKRADLEKREQATAMFIEKSIQRNAELAPVLTPFLPPEYQCHIAIAAFQKNQLANAREELLATAILRAKRQDGDGAAVQIGRIATELLQQGDFDLARELVDELYTNQKPDMESRTEARGKRGVARYFFPQLAILDFEKACELIRQHAYPNEIEALQTLALSLAVLTGKTDWKKGLEYLGRGSLGDSERSLVPGSYNTTPLPNEQFVESLLGQLKNERSRAMLCLYAAARLPNGSAEVQKKWLRRGVELLNQSPIEPPGNLYDTLGHVLREHLPKFGELDPEAARLIAFRCLEELHPFRDGEYFYLAERVAAAAEPLAAIDPQLSKILLEPFLNDLTWYQRSGANWQIHPLLVAGRVDPNWAGEVAQRFISGYMRDDKLRQINVLDSLVDGLSLAPNP